MIYTDDIIVKSLDSRYIGYHVSQLTPVNFISSGYCITRIKQGSGVWQIGNEGTRIHTGDFVFLNNLEYRCLTLTHEPITIESLWFSTTLCSSTATDECTRLFYGRGPSYTHRLSSHTLDEIFSRIRNELMSSRSFSLLCAYCYELICMAVREYELLSPDALIASPRDISDAELVTRSLSYINSHLADELSVPLLAAEAGMSRSQYTRKFEKYVSLSPAEYIVRCRVTCFMSKYRGAGNILKLAMECGFTSSSGFYKAFGKFCGCSPSEWYRNNH